MPVSISSNTIVPTPPFSASRLLIASIRRDNSPPDAIFDSGFSGSPGFGEIMNSITSSPTDCGMKIFPSGRIANDTWKMVLPMPRSFSCAIIFFSNSLASPCRASVS